MHITPIFTEALWTAYETHEQLGPKGEETTQTNQFGDTAILADIKCEEAVLSVLGRHAVPIQVISEEHGTTNITEAPTYLGILDGIDGSSLYKKMRGVGQYGTMFAIFNNTNPTYSDYVVCGIMQHATGRMFVAEKEQGAYILENGKRQSIHTSDRQQVSPGIRLFVDEYFSYNRETFSSPLREFNPRYEAASALYYAALAQGATDAVLECTRKGNLEIAVEYGLTREAGGAVIDLQGQDIGGYAYREFGQQEHVGVISAANQALAQAILRYIQR